MGSAYLRRHGMPYALLALAAGLACSGGGGGAGPATTGATALFVLPRAGAPAGEFYALPFPSDLRRRADGTVDLSAHSRALAAGTFVDFVDGSPGFGVSEAVFFRFDAGIDASTLPSEAASAAPGASVYLVDVSPGSPEHGRRIPLRFRYEASAGATIGPHWLSCLPVPGFTLRPLTTYAAVVTRRLHAADASAVARSPDFTALVDGGGDAAVASARPVHAALLAWLDEPGDDERADVVSAAVFTTADATDLLFRARAVVLASVAAPTTSDLSMQTSTASFTLYAGTYQGPIFQAGDAPYLSTGGGIPVDASGDPVVQRSEVIPFAVAYPTGVAPAAGWPVAIFFHGTGGDHLSFVDSGLAAALAAQGIASASIDAPLHGARYPGGPPTESQVEFAFFNPANPPAARDNVRQAAIDGFQLVRLLRTLSAPAPGLALDPDRIFAVGHSQGAFAGTLFAAAEPLVSGVVLAGGGGPYAFLTAHRTMPVNIRDNYAALLGDPDLDEFHDVLALLQMLQDPADPLAYAPLLLQGPPDGTGPRDVLLVEGIGDSYVLPASTEALAAAAGAAPATPVLEAGDALALLGLAALDPPVTGNASGRTAVLAQYAAAPGHEAHFVLFEDADASRQAARFLATLAGSGAATLEP